MTLTTGVDNVVGTAGPDNIFGVESGVAATDTFSALDVIDGAGGNDTLSLSNTDGTMTIGAATVKNVESLVHVNHLSRAAWRHRHA